MLTIGDVAHATGTSRRMLRHWEAAGLITPAAVDPSGYRRYAPSQVGRVDAIAALRDLGFGLDRIRDLLDPALTSARLTAVLRDRERELADRIAVDQESLGHVRRRLRSIEEGLLMTATTLQLHPLARLRLAGRSADVADESEIGHAIARLTAEVREHLDGEPAQLVRSYDATPGGPITVTVAVEIGDGDPPAGLGPIVLDAVDRAASISYDGALTNEADAWLALDDALQPHGLTTATAYRVHVTAATTTMQAAVTPRPDC